MEVKFIQDNVLLRVHVFSDLGKALAHAKNLYLDSTSTKPVTFWYSGWKYSVSNKD